MFFLSFSFNNVFKCFFTIFLLFIFSSVSLYSQTRIKEKVIINPTKSQATGNFSTQDYPPLEFQIGGPLPFTATITGPNGAVSGSGGGGTQPYWITDIPAVNGFYQISVSTNLEAGQISNVECTVSWGGPGIFTEAHYISNSGGSSAAIVTTTFSFTFNGISEPTPFNFYFFPDPAYLCGLEKSDLFVYPNMDINSLSDKNIQFAIQSGAPDLVFYNKLTGQSLGSSTITRLDNTGNIGIKLNSPFTGTKQWIKVSAFSNDSTRIDSIFVSPSSPGYSFFTENNFLETMHTSKIPLAIELINTTCYDPRSLDTSKIIVTIVEGQNLGHLKDRFSNSLFTSITNPYHDDGKILLDFVADGDELPVSDTVVVSVTSTNPEVEPLNIRIKVYPQKIIVTFIPSTIAPGDTANVILKKKTGDGSLSDFPQDRQYDIKLTDGAGYVTIFVPEWGITTDEEMGVMQGFKFIANEQITETPVSSTLLVKTSSGIIAGSVDPNNTLPEKSRSITNKNINRLNKTTSTLDDEQLWGEGTITITNDEPTIKITLTDSSKIWPYKAVSAGYNPITNVKIKVTNGDKPLANEKVKITIKRIERTGGHDHTNSSDLTLWGRISVNGVKGNPVTAYTDQNGEIITEEIRSSEFGGEYFIEVYLEASPGTKDKVDLQVKVDGLEPLPTSSYYELIGTRDHHLCQSSIPTSLHNSNHFGKPKLITAITKLASTYYLYFNEKIHINDMSIEYGGKFDTNNLWFGDHAEHRTGKNVDLAFKTSNNQNECLSVNKRYLKELVGKYSDDRLKIHNDHYHMRVK